MGYEIDGFRVAALAVCAISFAIASYGVAYKRDRLAQVWLLILMAAMLALIASIGARY